MNAYTMITVEEIEPALSAVEGATLGSDLSASAVAYSMWRYLSDASLLYRCYRRECDKSFVFCFIRLYRSQN